MGDGAMKRAERKRAKEAAAELFAQEKRQLQAEEGLKEEKQQLEVDLEDKAGLVRVLLEVLRNAAALREEVDRLREELERLTVTVIDLKSESDCAYERRTGGPGRM